MSVRELQPFSPRTLLALIALGATAFIAMAYFMIAGESGHAQRPASPTTTSRSAIGYRAFIELLRHFDLPAVAPTPAQLRRASLRIVLAPRTPQEVRAALVEMHAAFLVDQGLQQLQFRFSEGGCRCCA